MIHWDDLQVLKAIDDHEETAGGPVWDAPALMRRVANEKPVDENSQRRFVHELHVARRAGMLSYTLRVAPGQSEPRLDDSWYLQQVDNLSLTLDGRDRARGRLILKEPPDPLEDDGRLIAGLALESISRIIADSYTGSQLPHFLRESGLPASAVPHFEGTKWVYVQEVLQDLLEDSSSSRRILRTFLGDWLEDMLDTGPSDEQHLTVLVELGRQGWHLVDGRLVVGDRVAKKEMRARLETRVETGPTSDQLHPLLSKHVLALYDDGHLQAAVLEAFKLINARVKKLAPQIEADGKSLMGKAFGGPNPILRLNPAETMSDRDEQDGFSLLFMGAMTGIRNPKAHDPFVDTDDGRALEYLAFASLLLRRLDDVERLKGNSMQ